MSSKTLSISEDAYLRLRRLKRPKESFSDVIGRLAGRPDLMRYAGAISGRFGDELSHSLAATRARHEQDARKRLG